MMCNNKDATRPLGATRRLQVGLVALFIFCSITVQAQAPAPTYPDPEVIHPQGLHTAQDIVQKIYSSEEFSELESNPKYGGSKMQPTDVATTQMANILNGTTPEIKGVAAQRITLVFQVYGIGDGPLIDQIEQAIKRGMNVILITDANRSIKFDFAPDQAFRVDFGAGKILDNSTGTALKRFLQMGFKWGENLFSQPVYNTQAGSIELPILHRKDMAIWVDGKPVWLSSSNNNYNDPFRVGKTMVTTYGPALDYLTDFTKSTIETFKKGGEIKDIPRPLPRRFEAQDGTAFEIHFPGPQKFRNPIDYTIKKRSLALTHPEQYKVVRRLKEVFLITDRALIDDDRAAMKAQPDMKIQGVASNPFSQMGGWGLDMAYGGFTALTPLGRPELGFSADEVARSDFRIYQRLAPGVVVTHRTGEPQDYIIHSKTNIEESIQAGRGAITTVEDGSFNDSTHVENLEVQFRYELNTSDDLAKLFTAHTLLVMKQPWSIKMPEALIRNGMAAMLGRSVFEIPLTAVAQFTKAIKSADAIQVIKLLNRLNQSPSSIVSRPTATEIQQRLNALRDLIQWMHSQPNGAESLLNMTAQRIVYLLFLASGADGASQAKDVTPILNSIVFTKDIATEEMQTLANEVKAILAKNGIAVKTECDAIWTHR